MKTKKPMKKAGAGRRPAERYKLRYKAYRKPATLSSLKMLIGELLLFGNKQRKEFWQLFEVLLTQYAQNLTEYPSEPSQLKNSTEGGNRIGQWLRKTTLTQ